MRDSHIAQLEAQLESLVEGAFAHLFGKKVQAQDIALQLARGMEDGLRAANGDDNDLRPVAPDSYRIAVSQDAAQQLKQRRPNLAAALSQHLVELAIGAGYRMDAPPIVELVADSTLNSGEIQVSARHLNDNDNATNALDRVAIPTKAQQPLNPQLIIGNRTVLLNEPLLNVGRSLDNHIVIDDPHVSRQHVQIRLRFGRYMLFDVQSRGGTFVNDVMVREHTLQNGDVIRIGNTRLLYLEDDEIDQTDHHLSPLSPRNEDA